jgi:hypothetical protein
VQLSETEKDVLLYSNMMERIKQDLKEDNMQVLVRWCQYAVNVSLPGNNTAVCHSVTR